MSDLFFPVTPAGTAEVERPAPDRVVKGDPVFTSWTLEDRDGLYCGIWESTPGGWRVSYDEWAARRSPFAQATVSCCVRGFAAHGRWWKPPARIS